MKKLWLMLLLAASTTGFAQQFSFGIKGGTNISNFTNVKDLGDITKQSLIGYYVGAYLDFWVGNNFAIQPEVLLSTAGAKFKDADVTEKYKLTYLTIPLFLKYKANGGFYVEAGPQVGFKLSESIPDQTFDNFAKALDLSIGAGLGYQSAGGFGVGARYLVGLSKVGDFDASSGIDPNFKNSTIQIGISYTIGGGPKGKK
jgi:hypothetical protein